MTVVLGVIGGIGSGKSAVSKSFAKEGAVVLNADVLAHEVLKFKSTKDALLEVFGDDILNASGEIDRAAMAAKVFGPGKEEALNRLNEIVHPAVRVEIDRRLAEARKNRAPMVILDIPLLLGSPFKDECQHILFIKVSKETRLKRVQSRNWSPEELDRRESSQLSLAKKEAASDLIIENEGTIEELDLQVKKLYEQLVKS